MLVKEFIEKFRWFNPDASVCIDGVPIRDVKITHSTKKGVEPYNCQSINIKTIDVSQMPPEDDHIVNHVVCSYPKHCISREYHPDQPDCQACFDENHRIFLLNAASSMESKSGIVKYDYDIPSFLNGNKED
jgi:hypothetical protein